LQSKRLRQELHTSVVVAQTHSNARNAAIVRIVVVIDSLVRINFIEHLKYSNHKHHKQQQPSKPPSPSSQSQSQGDNEHNNNWVDSDKERAKMWRNDDDHE
jgi:hypothetical protein